MQEIALPSRRVHQDANGANIDGHENFDDGTTTKFALLSKKGNKPQVCLVVLRPFFPVIYIVHDKTKASC